MRLKVTDKGKEKRVQKELNRKRGKSAKRKGSNYERVIAKKFQSAYNVELKRTPQSGGFAKKSEIADDFRGDITIIDPKQVLLVHIECKDQKQWSLPKWISQSVGDCPRDKVPLVIFHQYQTSKDFVCLSLEDFFKVVERDKIVGNKEFIK